MHKIKIRVQCEISVPEITEIREFQDDMCIVDHGVIDIKCDPKTDCDHCIYNSNHIQILNDTLFKA